MIKDLEFFFKKLLFSESYLLKKRLIRAIKKNYEKELQIIDRFADKSKDALDIGVYRGVYSYKLSPYFKKIHSFEPNPLLFPYLERNLKKIITNIQLYNMALSDKNGKIDLKLPLRSKSIFKDNIEELFKLGAASIHPKKTFNKFRNIPVQISKLDNIKLGNNIKFIKIDVEGHEIEVLKGAEKTIKDNLPVLLIEIEKRHNQRNVEDSISTINEFGYKCYFVKNKELVSSDKLENKDLENNYFFLPN